MSLSFQLGDGGGGGSRTIFMKAKQSKAKQGFYDDRALDCRHESRVSSRVSHSLYPFSSTLRTPSRIFHDFSNSFSSHIAPSFLALPATVASTDNRSFFLIFW